MTSATVEVSVVLPCLNEEAGVEECVVRALQGLGLAQAVGEVIVCDNGSHDRSADRAAAAGARVVHEPRRGYGRAILTGVAHAQGDYIVIADADGSYDLGRLAEFVEPLRRGADVVMGDRFRGGIAPGAMPWLHQYVGNPVLSFILRLLFGATVADVHCGMRAATRQSLARLRLISDGMEFASEMIIRAAALGLRIEQVPIRYYPRRGESKLRTLRDGWRHLRLMLLYSPSSLFLAPGLALALLGAVILVALLPGPLHVAGASFDFHFMFVGSLLLVVGSQVATLAVFASLYADQHHLRPLDDWMAWLGRRLNLERVLALGMLIAAVGTFFYALIAVEWVRHGFANLFELRRGIVALTLSALGVQIVFSAFLAHLLGIAREPGPGDQS